MGNASSASGKQTAKSLSNVIDEIATNYILRSNFRDLKNLTDMKYCDNLVVLTSDIISKNFTAKDVNFLSQRMRGTEEINEMTRDKVMFFDRENLSKLDVKNSIQKKRMCIGIAKFYIKVAHLFSAIVTTINPTYIYKNENGETQTVGLMDKREIPEGATTKLQRNSLCSRRINSLINNNDYDVLNDKEITVNPTQCKINYDKKNQRDKTLKQEPGIPDLEFLYFDKYNYGTGAFGGRANIEENMTSEMYEEYKKDLLTFYKAFTGNDKIPDVEVILPSGEKQRRPAIGRFGEIPLRSYHKTRGCSEGGIFTRTFKGTLKERLFGDYATHVKAMMKKTEDNQNKLLNILDKVFVYAENEEGSRSITVNPSLSEKGLDKLIAESRKLIISLYIECEEDYNIGLKLFEAIVENQMLYTSKRQIENLQKDMDEIIAKKEELIVNIPENEIEQDARMRAQGLPDAVIASSIHEEKSQQQGVKEQQVQAPAQLEVEGQVVEVAPLQAHPQLDGPVQNPNLIQEPANVGVPVPPVEPIPVEAPIQAPSEAMKPELPPLKVNPELLVREREPRIQGGNSDRHGTNPRYTKRRSKYHSGKRSKRRRG